MKLNVLILTHDFIPEFGGAATMQYELARHLARSRHTVTVITSVPAQHLNPKSRLLTSETENIDGIRVIRIHPPRLRSTSFASREINAVLSDIHLVLKGLRIKPVNILFMMTPPITLPIFAWIIKKIRKSISIMYMQDSFPEFLISMNLMTRNNLLFRFAKTIEKITYKSADYIGVHSPKNKAYVAGCGIEEKKIHVVPLWVDTDFIQQPSRSDHFTRENHLENKFVIMYAGTVGYAMGAKTIPRAAKLLEKEGDIRFVVVGEGSRYNEMQEEMQRLEVKNIQLVSPRPREELPDVLASSDVLLVLLRKELSNNPNGYFKASIPHKLLSNMASGKPVILSAEIESDAAELVRISRCGIPANAEDPEALAEAILEMKKNKRHLAEYGRDGRQFAKDHFDSVRQTIKLEEFFLHAVENSPFEFNDPWSESLQNPPA